MNEESKEAIEKVFKNFDKDNSGFIEIIEIGKVAKELGKEVPEEEIKRIFKDLDVNKDGKISFNEFWEWWTYGCSNSLEELVFLKLKIMNLLKKAHSEFVRMGGSLESKFNDKIDRHYFAVNMGESKCGTSLAFNINMGNQKIISNTYGKYIEESIDIKNEDNIQILLNFHSLEPKRAKVELEKFVDNFLKPGLAARSDAISNILDDIKITYLNSEEIVTMQIEIASHNLNQMVINPYKEAFLKQAGENFNLEIDFHAGFMRDILHLMKNKNEKLVNFFCKGFLFESRIKLNSDFLKIIRKFIVDAIGSKKKIDKPIVLLSMLKASKFHLVFRDIEDVNCLFEGLGINKLAEEQPSSKDILDELSHFFKLNSDLKKKFFFIFKIIDFFKEYSLAKSDNNCVIIKMPHFLVKINLYADGLAEFFDYIFEQEPSPSDNNQINEIKKIVFLGLDNSGKSTLLTRLKHDKIVTHNPTIHPKEEEMFIGSLKSNCIDLGGDLNVRKIWKDYISSDLNAIVYIIDVGDKSRFNESKIELENIASLEILKDIPILILGNKTDLNSGVSENYLKIEFGIEKINHKYINLFMCSVINNIGFQEGFVWLENNLK